MYYYYSKKKFKIKMIEKKNENSFQMYFNCIQCKNNKTFKTIIFDCIKIYR